MQVAVEFPLTPHRWGQGAVLELARGIEALGYDEIDLLEHVTVGLPTPTRAASNAASDTLEPLVALSAIGAVTRRIGLGTEILILPQRQPALVAKQVATLDVLAGGRVRLGVGAGWQQPEYESLGVPFAERGRRLDESIELMRLYWTAPSVTYHGRFYRAEAMGMEPKPVQTGGPPIWIGGDSDAALRRVGRLGDGWLAMGEGDDLMAAVPAKVAVIRAAAEAAGRDFSRIGLQGRLSDVGDLDRLAVSATELRTAGFTWATVAMPALEAGGARSVAAQLDALARIKERISREIGS